MAIAIIKWIATFIARFSSAGEDDEVASAQVAHTSSPIYSDTSCRKDLAQED